MLKKAFFTWLLFLPAAALAAGKGATLSETGTVHTIMSLGLGLVVVLGLIFGCAWLVRRVNGLHGVNTSAMRIVSVMSVGQRERIVLLEVGGQQILVGVTAHNVRTLHVFDEPVVSPKSPRDSEFASRLQSMLQKGFGAADKGADVKRGGRS